MTEAITTPETPAVQQTETPSTPAPVAERPSWLPEKFQSPEAMAEAYKALESKMGQSAPQTPTPQTPPPMDPPTDSKVAENVVKESGLDYSAFSEEYQTGGKLSDQSYEKLAQAGIPREMVDAYIQGQEAVADNIRHEVFSSVGGEEKFQQMSQWAAVNMSKAELEAFNTTVETGSVEQIKLAVRALHNSYTAANGSAPNYVNMGANTQASSDVFRSTAELVEAMSNPKYATDEAYRRDVEQKLSRSNI